MIRGTLGRAVKIVIGGMCGTLLLLAFGPAWAQNRPGRAVPNVYSEPVEDDAGDIQPHPRVIRVGPEMVPYGVPVESDQFESETMEMIDAYRQATDDKSRANVRTKLVAHLAKKFDSQRQRREKEISELKAPQISHRIAREARRRPKGHHRAPCRPSTARGRRAGMGTRRPDHW